MRFQHPLDDAFRTRSHMRILRVLDELPAGFATSAREIARRARISHPTASGILATLSEQGIVMVRRLPRTDLFELNEAHVLVDRLRSLFEWERGLQEELLSTLRDYLRHRRSLVREAFVFGSVARGDMEPSSDVDLAIIVEPGKVEAVQEAIDIMIELVRRRFGNRLNIIVEEGSLEALRASGRRGRMLWANIAREGIPLFAGGKVSSAHA